MILLSTILTISKRRPEKNSFEILPGSGIEIRGRLLAPTYRYILYCISGKLTSKRASWNYAKLALGQVLSKTVRQPLQVPHTLCWFFFISIWVKWAYKTWRAGIILNYKKILDVNLHKNIEPVFVKHYVPNICLPLNMPSLHSALFPHKNLDFAEKLKR